jgi:Ala-tRNA(Pro) deacylase
MEVSMPASKLSQYLESHRVRYSTVPHPVAFTAQEIASLTHISGDAIAKVVIAFADERMVMAVVPASRHVDLDRLQRATGARAVCLATEAEFRDAFPDCELGAMPPFGNLYGLRVYIDESLIGRDLVFNAGNHHELIRMPWTNYVVLVQPNVCSLTTPAIVH